MYYYFWTHRAINQSSRKWFGMLKIMQEIKMMNAAIKKYRVKACCFGSQDRKKKPWNFTLRIRKMDPTKNPAALT